MGTLQDRFVMFIDVSSLNSTSSFRITKISSSTALSESALRCIDNPVSIKMFLICDSVGTSHRLCGVVDNINELVRTHLESGLSRPHQRAPTYI